MHYSNIRFFTTRSIKQVICSFNDLQIANGKAIKFKFDENIISTYFGTTKLQQKHKKYDFITGFVFLCGKTMQPRAYLNRCPHAHLELDFDDSEFFRDGFLHCKVHGAYFDPETGVCLKGPAAKRTNLTKQLTINALPQLNVVVQDDNVILLNHSMHAGPITTKEEIQDKKEKLHQVIQAREVDMQRMHRDINDKAMQRIQMYAERDCTKKS